MTPTPVSDPVGSAKEPTALRENGARQRAMQRADLSERRRWRSRIEHALADLIGSAVARNYRER
jgi:hypothetical protein